MIIKVQIGNKTLIPLLKHADIAVASLTVTESREKVVDFSIPYMYYTREILIKKSPPGGTVDLLQFMNPFDSLVWFATLASLVVISVAVFVINYYSPYGYKDDNGRGTSQEFSFFNSVWFALACMLQQGGDNTPRSLSGIGCSTMKSIIIFQGYSLFNWSSRSFHVSEIRLFFSIVSLFDGFGFKSTMAMDMKMVNLCCYNFDLDYKMRSLHEFKHFSNYVDTIIIMFVNRTFFRSSSHISQFLSKIKLEARTKCIFCLYHEPWTMNNV